MDFASHCTSNSNLRNELEKRPVVILFAKNMNEYSTFKSKVVFTGSLSNSRTTLPESSSRPLPAQRPNHAT